MEFEKLYALVHSLTKAQRANLSRLYPSKKRTQVMELFRRIFDRKVLDANTEAIIRGTKFKNSGKYYSYRAALAELIIKSLVIEETDSVSVPQIPFIRRAYLEEAPTIATRTLVAEMVKAQETEDFGLSLRFYDFIDEMKFFYRIQIDPPHELRTFDEISSEKGIRSVFLEHLQTIRNTVHLTKAERLVVVARIESRLSVPYWSRTNADLALKIQTNLCLLREDFHAGFLKAEVLLGRMKNWPEKYPPSMIAEEAKVLALYAVENGVRDWASKLSKFLSTISGQSQFERKVITRASVFVGVTIAETYGIESVGVATLDRILAHPDYFPTPLKRKLLFFLAMCFVYNGNYPKASQIMNMVRQGVSSEDFVLAWEPAAVLAICHFEIGNTDLADSMLRAASRVVNSTDSAYAKLSVRLITRISKAKPAMVPAIVKENLKHLNELQCLDSEKAYSKFLNICPWLLSKMESKPAKEFLRGNAAAEARQWSSR